MLPINNYRIAFNSANTGWGGSEELWSQAAAFLAGKGHHVSAFVELPSTFHPRVEMLKSAGCKVSHISATRLPWIQRILNRFLHYDRAFTPQSFAAEQLARSRPDLTVISQGGNFDGLSWARICRERHCPYVMIAQLASTCDWPKDRILNEMQLAYQSAVRSYFVSHSNLELTQHQLGTRLNNAEVVRNPFLVEAKAALPWPAGNAGIKLACVARLSAKVKGQDLLFCLMAQEKWRNRRLELSLFGTGFNEQGMRQLARMLELQNVIFRGHVEDITAIWQEHHALILPSRHEGLPLAIVEAMMCGRPCIVTDVSGNTEVVEDELTGFVAAAPTVSALDEAMERAWNRRSDWQQIGSQAAARIRELVPSNPAQVFAEKLLKLLENRQN